MHAALHGNAPLLEIRSATDADSSAVHAVVLAAFGKAQGPEIVDLIDSLSKDASAMPVLSFVATCQARVVGHILFSNVRLTDAREQVAASILAPLCVHPDCQQQGIGGSLIRFGLNRLQAMGVGLVFVLGHPDYIPSPRFCARRRARSGGSLPDSAGTCRRLDGAGTATGPARHRDGNSGLRPDPCRSQALAGMIPGPFRWRQKPADGDAGQDSRHCAFA